MGCSDRWRGWMQAFVSVAYMSVLVNRSLKCFFNICKGIKEGDPLSPFLYVMVAESLHKTL